MTLAVTVVCQDGVVVAADSRTTLANHRMLRVGSDFTHKVFESGGVAVATYGEAFVADRSIASHMAEFSVVEAGNCDHPGPTGHRLAEFFGDRYDAQAVEADDAPPPGVTALGFLVCGYDDTGVGEAWEVTLPERLVAAPVVRRIATAAGGYSKGMRFKMGFAAGFAVGYWVGATPATERRAKLDQVWTGIRDNPRVQRVTDTVTRDAHRVGDAVEERIVHGADGATDAIAGSAAPASGTSGSQGAPASGTSGSQGAPASGTSGSQGKGPSEKRSA